MENKMKQVEITSRVTGDLELQIKKLQNQGFSISKRGRVEDEYLSQEVSAVNTSSVLSVLSRCVLLRYIKENDRICKQITYKNKEYLNGETMSEEKYNIPCDDLSQAKKLFSALGFKSLVHVKYDVIEMKRDNFHFAFQNVDGLGVLVECESPIDFSNSSLNDIKEEKKKLWYTLKNLGVELTEDFDVKKAKELTLLAITQKEKNVYCNNRTGRQWNDICCNGLERDR